MQQDNTILIDVSRLIWRVSSGRLPTGIDRVCLAYLAHYSPSAQAVVQWKGLRRILPPAFSAALFDLILSNASDFRSKVALMALRHLPQVLASQSGNGRPYLNIGHTGLDRSGLSEWLVQANVRPIFMIHDLIPITHPEYCRPGGAETHEKRIELMLRTGNGIIGNSQATLDMLASHTAAYDLPAPPMLAAWLGATRLPASDTKPLGVDHPFFVALGTIEGRKNHLMLLNMWRGLVAKQGFAAPRLVIIGQRGWESDEALSLLDTDPALSNHVIELPRCTDAELAHYLRDAQALLFPSFAEGYGMPLVEALGVGTPVIASDLEVFRELAGDIPDYLDPIDAAGWQAAVEDYASNDSPSRQAQMDRMTGYAMPTWAEHFAKVDQWLETLTSKK